MQSLLIAQMWSFRIAPLSQVVILGLIGLAIFSWVHPVAAQAEPFYPLTGALIHQFDADLDSPGSYSVSSLLFRATVGRPVGRKTFLASSLSYDFLDYDFSDEAQLDAASPWDHVHGLNLGLPIIRQIGERWSMIVNPSIGSYGASGANFSDTLTYGVVFVATYAFRPDRKLGFGVGAFERLGESRGFPFISIDWQLTDRIRLMNPLAAGPTGPAGLELVYEISPTWEFGAGGAYRSLRFRLDEQDLEPNGIGEQRGIATFARILHKLYPKLNLVIYTGLILDGELRTEDAQAQRRRAVEHDPAPLLAISLSGRF